MKLDEFQNLASVTSKMTSRPQRPWKGLSDFFKVAEAKFWISSNFNGFSFRIFVILSFEVF